MYMLAIFYLTDCKGRHNFKNIKHFSEKFTLHVSFCQTTAYMQHEHTLFIHVIYMLHNLILRGKTELTTVKFKILWIF